MMEANKSILYIGNNLIKKTEYSTTMSTLSYLLELENYFVIKSSSKVNKLFRLFDMCFSVIKYSNRVDFVLIDTFSTSNFYYALCTSQIARVLKIKYIPILHGGNLPERLDKSKRLSNLIFKNSYKNVAPSNYLKTAFEERNYPTIYVPNILEIEKYKFQKRINLTPKLLWVRAFKHLYNPMLAVEVLNLLKKEFPNLISIAVEPEGSDVIKGGKAGPHAIQGIGAGFVPENLDLSVIDRTISITKDEAYAYCRMAALKEGLLVGISTWASLAAISKIEAELKGKTVLTLSYDRGDRYLSVEGLFED